MSEISQKSCLIVALIPYFFLENIKYIKYFSQKAYVHLSCTFGHQICNFVLNNRGFVKLDLLYLEPSDSDFFMISVSLSINKANM